MPQRPPSRPSAPAEVLRQLNGGYNGYTDPTLTSPQQWSLAVNVFSGQFGSIQRCRFCNLAGFGFGLPGFGLGPFGGTGLPFKSLKYFAVPGVGAYLLGDIAGKLYSFNTSGYTFVQRLNPYIDPTGSGSGLASLAGPWSREILQNIAYEMNGSVKQTGRGANAATIESFGLDAPDSSPQVAITAGAVQNITAIARLNGTVSVTLAGALTVPGGNGIGLINVLGVGDTSFNGTFIVATGSGTANLTWAQAGQDTTPGAAGTVDTKITKAIGRSYAWAWENANKPHVSAPSPSTQYIQYNAQKGEILPLQPGTVATNSLSTIVTGTGTAFTSAWIGRSLWVNSAGASGRIVSVQSATQLTLAANAPANVASGSFQVYDISATHLRLYETADGGATYFRTARNSFNPAGTTTSASGLDFLDSGNSEPPNFPFTTETSQINNLPPPIGPFLNEYQNRILVYGISGANQTFFYSNIETTTIGLAQESFAPLNQITLPIANGQLNGMIEFPGSLIIWSDKQDMFRLTGLLTDNTVSNTGTQQGAQITRLPYAIGCASPFAADISPLGGMWLSTNAEIWLYTDKYAPRNVGQPVQDILNTITPGNLSLTRAKYFHSNKRNWMAFSIAANGSSFCNTLLVCDLDLLASNGAPSYFEFDMATNSPTWYVFNVGPVSGGAISPRSDSIEVVYQTDNRVRLLIGGIDLIQDADFRPGSSGTEITVPGAQLKTHPYGNESAFAIKRPSFIRFDTASDPSTLAALGWSFAVEGIDDDFYTFLSPLVLSLTPGVNDTSSLCGNPNLSGGESFRHSPCLYRIGGVNFVAGRRLRFQVNFPSSAGQDFQFQSIQIGTGANPPR